MEQDFETTLNQENVWTKNKKKIIGVVAVIAIIIVVAILAFNFLGGPEKVVKNYVKETNKLMQQGVDSLAIKEKYIDAIGNQAWEYSSDAEDFSEEDYKEFIEKYKEVEEEAESEDGDNKKKEVKLKKVKSTDKIGKKLYLVKAVILAINGDDENSQTVNFIVYKNKIINPISF